MATRKTKESAKVDKPELPQIPHPLQYRGQSLIEYLNVFVPAMNNLVKWIDERTSNE